MGMMSLLFNTSLQCFHILAWPLLALGYPLYASIQAIEANSNLDTRKLITYWVCLSLILLFDHAFHWLPYWPYVKLIIVGFLVIPHFNGSFYVYNKHLVSIKPRIVFNSFIKMLEIISKEDNLLTEAKKEAKETKPLALQNLIDFKEGAVERPKVEQKDIIDEEMKEKNELSATDPITQAEAGFELRGGTDIYDLMGFNNKKPQNEWTCAMCQVTTSREADHISHLRGKRHAYELKPKYQPLEASVALANSGQTSAETSDSKTSQTLWTCVLCKVKCTGKISLISHFQGKPHLKALESLKAKPTTTYYFKPWTCEICKTQLKNKNDLILHLESKRHASACENQKMETKRSVQDEVSSVWKKKLYMNI